MWRPYDRIEMAPVRISRLAVIEVVGIILLESRACQLLREKMSPRRYPLMKEFRPEFRNELPAADRIIQQSGVFFACETML